MKNKFILSLSLISLSCSLGFSQTGTLDLSFNSTGKSTPVSTSNNLYNITKVVDFPTGAPFDQAGELYQMSNVLVSGNIVTRISAFNEDGSVKTSFNGGQGYKDYSFGSGNSFIGKDIEIREDSKIVVGFETYSNGTKDVGVFIIDENGNLQTSFNSTGYFIKDLQATSGNDEVGAIGCLINGSIVISGGSTPTVSSNTYDTYILVVNISGVETGFQLHDFYTGPDSYEYISSVHVKKNVTNPWSVTENSYTLFGGGSDLMGGTSAFILKGAFDGTLVPTFGSSGIINLASSIGTVTDGCVDVSGNVYVVGSGFSGNPEIQRFTPTGTLDLTFDTDGKKSIDFPQALNNPSINTRINSDLAFTASMGNDLAVARLLTNGNYDPSFNADGQNIITTGYSYILNSNCIVQPDSKIISSHSYYTTTYFDVLFRLNGEPITGDCNGDGIISATEVVGDVNCDGAINRPTEVCGDLNGDGDVLDSGEIAGDQDGNGTIEYPTEVCGDLNGDGDALDSDETAGDQDGDGDITFPTEVCGDLNGDGDVLDTDEIAGDQNGDGDINRPTEVCGDLNGNGTIDIPTEIVGDQDGDGSITFPSETCGDLNGNGTIDAPDEKGGDVNGNGTIENPEISGDTNGNGTLDSSEQVGIKENASISIDVYPNPTKSILTINTSINIESIELSDLTGRVVLSQKDCNNTWHIINLSNLAKGSYILKINSIDISTTKTIIKE